MTSRRRTSQESLQRLIEVKSLAGAWGSGGFPRLTPTQFKHAGDAPEIAWLYVVEHAESDDPTVVRIADPAGRVDRFVFDPGWRALGEPDDELVGLSAEARALAEAVQATGLPEPEIGFALNGDAWTLALAWPDMRVGAVNDNERELVLDGWTIRRASDWTLDQLLDALGAR